MSDSTWWRPRRRKHRAPKRGSSLPGMRLVPDDEREAAILHALRPPTGALRFTGTVTLPAHLAPTALKPARQAPVPRLAPRVRNLFGRTALAAYAPADAAESAEAAPVRRSPFWDLADPQAHADEPTEVLPLVVHDTARPSVLAAVGARRRRLRDFLQQPDFARQVAAIARDCARPALLMARRFDARAVEQEQRLAALEAGLAGLRAWLDGWPEPLPRRVPGVALARLGFGPCPDWTPALTGVTA